jgi:hypothetical protein
MANKQELTDKERAAHAVDDLCTLREFVRRLSHDLDLLDIIISQSHNKLLVEDHAERVRMHLVTLMERTR